MDEMLQELYPLAPYIALILVSVVAIITIGIVCSVKKNRPICKNEEGEICESKCGHMHRLHNWLAIIVAIVCCTALLTISMAGDTTAFNMFSFASTLASVILSLIAIFMTISGESRMYGLKNRIEVTTTQLNQAMRALKGQKQEYDELIKKYEEQVSYQNNMLKEQRELFVEMITESKKFNENLQKFTMTAKEVDIPEGTKYNSNVATEVKGTEVDGQ